MSEVDYGPLQGLIGTWTGDKGLDVSPTDRGREESPYYETIELRAGGTVRNAGEQELAIVPYHQVVTRKSNDQVFHDEVGYWLWDASRGVVMHSLAIPRAVCVIAGGTAEAQGGDGTVVLQVAASLGDAEWGIVQSPFMRDNASTVAFRHRVEVGGDRLSYAETTVLEIYGKRFEHTDENTLSRAS